MRLLSDANLGQLLLVKFDDHDEFLVHCGKHLGLFEVEKSSDCLCIFLTDLLSLVADEGLEESAGTGWILFEDMTILGKDVENVVAKLRVIARDEKSFSHPGKDLETERFSRGDNVVAMDFDHVSEIIEQIDTVVGGFEEEWTQDAEGWADVLVLDLRTRFFFALNILVQWVELVTRQRCMLLEEVFEVSLVVGVQEIE